MKDKTIETLSDEDNVSKIELHCDLPVPNHPNERCGGYRETLQANSLDKAAFFNLQTRRCDRGLCAQTAPIAFRAVEGVQNALRKVGNYSAFERELAREALKRAGLKATFKLT